MKECMEFNIDERIRKINKVTPKRYFKRNVPQYTFVTYISHILFLFKNEDYIGVLVFVRRFYVDIEDSRCKAMLQPEYIIEVNTFLKDLYIYIEQNDLLSDNEIERYMRDWLQPFKLKYGIT